MPSTFARSVPAGGTMRFAPLGGTNRPLSVTVQFFFDRRNVINQLERGHLRAMSRIGASLRTIMQRSMRQSTSATPHSNPPTPPRWTTKLLRGSASGGGPGIFYSYDPQIRGVVVGPVKIQTNPYVKPVGKTIPQLLNEGGKASAKGNQLVIVKKGKRRVISPYSRGGAMISRRLRTGKRSSKAYSFFRMKRRTFTYPSRNYTDRTLLVAIQRGVITKNYQNLW